jgi:hypothetical protein
VYEDEVRSTNLKEYTRKKQKVSIDNMMFYSSKEDNRYGTKANNSGKQAGECDAPLDSRESSPKSVLPPLTR